MEFTQTQKDTLLKLAQDSIKYFLENNEPIPYPAYLFEGDELSEFLTEQNACFVTLHKNQDLRGCIGTTAPSDKLVDNIIRYAVSAATEDDRFARVEIEELAEIKIEISILSVAEKCENMLDFELGVHGLILSDGFSKGLFLPQVATENNFTKEQFLENLCLKANLLKNAYLQPGIILEKFTAQIIK
jgi:uncharacterized protein